MAFATIWCVKSPPPHMVQQLTATGQTSPLLQKLVTIACVLQGHTLEPWAPSAPDDAAESGVQGPIAHTQDAQRRQARVELGDLEEDKCKHD